MIKEYETFNKNARKYFLDLIQRDERNTDKELFDRCIDEINNLYDKELLPIIKWLYIYKKQYKNTKYSFNGTINNYYLLYKLGLNDIDPIKYNLAYEISDDYYNIQFRTLDKDITDFVTQTNSMQNEFKICKCDSSNVKYFDESVEFYVIKMNSELKSIGDLNYDKEIPIIVLDENTYYKEVYLTIYSDEIDKENFEKLDKEIKKIEEIVKPTTEEKYTEVTLLGLNSSFPQTKQEELFMEEKLDIGDLITCREDVYDYLIKHNVDKELSRKITKYVRQGKAKRNFNPTRWEQYKNIMKEHNCEDWFIRTLEQVDYLFAKSYGIKLTKKIYKDKVK